jgi:hypothetical protein
MKHPKIPVESHELNVSLPFFEAKIVKERLEKHIPGMKLKAA